MKRLFNFLNNLKVDKLLHFIVGVILGLIMMWIGKFFLPLLSNGVLALSIVFLVSLAKEYYDKTHKGVVDILDIVATFIGGVVGILIALLFIIL